ncbi:NirA family protein [Candidatus Methylacidithermus pantelleriae]|uniref:Ferredoxin--nitrite reductase n=1 Tax=Candidatus Methylacidithermus pantelleriae TaxID=2744239 RepID=A0A8J2FT76_9BACT|nr:NirA family protein [Candidatus Methylacidithermus pantelleriae]CAF0700838.1 Ferredoxin--nitrite reductase [Candidatus Methylacidithermus pantelleriae]
MELEAKGKASSAVVDKVKAGIGTLQPVQERYLQGFFAGLAERGISFWDAVSQEASLATSPPVESPSLTFEERVKKEEHPLDSYYRLLEHAEANRAPDREHTFRFKWYGLFYLSPVKESFMARIRIPAGQLQSFQLREIAKIAKELTTGYIQVTTRANIQIRLIQVRDAPEVLRRLSSVGLYTRGSGADNIRNITAHATTGIDPYEWIDVSPYCHKLAHLILSQREFYDLPRKFNVAFDGGGLVPVVEDTNDIGVRAVGVGTDTGQPEVLFRIRLGGVTGHGSFGTDLGVLVEPDRIVSVVAALIKVYLKNGDRSDRRKARVKYLLEKWGVERYLQETEKLLGHSLRRSPFREDGSFEGEVRKEKPFVAHPHIGVHPQKQPGFYYLGVALPVGQVTANQLLRLADLADHYGQGEVRTTVWQNFLLPHIPEGYVETVKKALVKMGLHWQQSPIASGVIACTGNRYCKYSSTDTKGHALELVKHLEKRVKLDQPVNIHLTGCPNSCAQHYIGDIGLLGVKGTLGGSQVEAYHVFVGGGFGEHRALGRQLFYSIPSSELPHLVERMLKVYLAKREPGETFQAFTARHDINTLQRLFSQDE